METLQIAPALEQTTEETPEYVQRFRMTYEEFLEWADEDTYAEWVDGEVFVYMSAKPGHQSVAGFLYALMKVFVDFFQLGEVYQCPLQMKIEGGSGRDPDLLFIARENLDRLTEDILAGPADLVVEVVSDDSEPRDRKRKFKEYEAAGVPEYWVLDPRPRQKHAQFWILGPGGRYQAGLVEDGVYRSTIIPGFWIREAWLWAEDRPDTLLTFAEIAHFPVDLIQRLRAMAARNGE